MKHLIFGTLRMLVGLLVVAFVLGCEDDKPLGDGYDFGDNDPGVIVAIGDSITSGRGVGASQAYPAILSGLTGKTVVNRGTTGVHAPESVGTAVNALANYQPGFMVILLGSNDVLHGYDTEASIAALRQIVEAAKGRQAIPVLMTLTPMTGGHEAFAGTARNLSNRIRQLAGETGTALVDVESAFGGGETYMQEDGLHPNVTGQGVIASALAGVF